MTATPMPASSREPDFSIILSKLQEEITKAITSAQQIRYKSQMLKPFPPIPSKEGMACQEKEEVQSIVSVLSNEIFRLSQLNALLSETDNHLYEIIGG